MFTGLIEVTAEVLNRSEQGIVVQRPALFKDIRIGSSIAVSGACLTVSLLTDEVMAFDVHEETWKRTKLGTLKKGDGVNLERALKAGDRFEGHIVQGHVDSVGTVSSLRAGDTERGARRRVAVKQVEKPFGYALDRLLDSAPAGASLEENITISYPSSLRGLIVEKGSIAIDGVSLTVASVSQDCFSVALIPQTLTRTTLGRLVANDLVNLEADILGKYIRR